MQPQAKRRRPNLPPQNQPQPTKADAWFNTPGVAQRVATPTQTVARPPPAPELGCTGVISVQRFKLGCEACWRDLDAQLLTAAQLLQAQGADQLANLDASDLHIAWPPKPRGAPAAVLHTAQGPLTPSDSAANAMESLAAGASPGQPVAAMASAAAATTTAAGTPAHGRGQQRHQQGQQQQPQQEEPQQQQEVQQHEQQEEDLPQQQEEAETQQRQEQQQRQEERQQQQQQLQQEQQQQRQEQERPGAQQLLYSFHEAARVCTKPPKLLPPMAPVDADAGHKSDAGVAAASTQHGTAEAAEAAAGVGSAPMQLATARTAQNGTGGPEGELLSPDELLITVAVYDGAQAHIVGDHPSLATELQLLGSQPLTALRDALNCPTDALLRSVQGAGVPGAYICVEGDFYCDDRAPNAGDSSAAIREYCVRRGISHPRLLHRKKGSLRIATTRPSPAAGAGATGGAPTEIPVGSMATTTWADLKLRVGNTPLDVLCHQGCCEHALMVTDVRRCHQTDAQRVGAYPRVLWQATEGQYSRKRRCQVCGRRRDKSGDRLVTGCREAPGDPCLVCAGCCALLVEGAQQRGQTPVVYKFAGSSK